MPIHVAIVGVAPIRAMDLIGPAEVFMEAHRQRIGHTVPANPTLRHFDPVAEGENVYRVHFLSGNGQTNLDSQASISVFADSTMAAYQDPIDTLLLADGEVVSFRIR